MLGSETLVYAGNARQKVEEVTSYFRTPGISLLDWQKLGLWARWEGRRPQPAPFGLGAEPANTGTSPLPQAVPTSTPKTACREVRERQWRSAAPVSAPASAGAGRSPLGAAPGAAGVTKSLLSLPQNRRKHGFSPVSLHVLHGYVVRVGFKVRLFDLVFIRSQPFHPLHQNAPGFAFSGFAGCASLLSSFDSRKSRIFALSLALEMIQDSVEHLNSGFRSRGGKRGKLRFFCRVAQNGSSFLLVPILKAERILCLKLL